MSQPGASFSFVHAADLHLDTPFVGVQASAPHVADALRDASLAAFDSLVDIAIERGVAFVLLAGDIYDGAVRGLRAQLRLRSGLDRLSDAGIATFVVHGNHDPVEEGWAAINRWPDGVTVFGAESVDVVPVHRNGELLATVQGISYARRATTENLVARFRRPDAPGVHVGLLHCNVEGAPSEHANYSPCTLEDLRATRLDYLALGHVHERRVVLAGPEHGEPWAVYPGNTQARSPRASEAGAKGVVVVEVHDGVVQPPEFVPCDRVRFVTLRCPIGEMSDLGDLETELRERAESALDAAEGRSLVLRAVLDGSGELHSQLAHPSMLDELLQHLRDDSSTAAPFCWWDAIEDGSTLALDRSEIARRGDFAADLLALSNEIDDVDGLLERIRSEAPRALQRTLEELATDPASQAHLLERAADIALDALLETP